LIAAAFVVLPLVSLTTAKKIIAGAGIIAILFAFAPHNPVASRLASSFDVQEGSNQGRLSNWQQAFNVISKNPFGVGIGAYSLAVNPSASYREPIYAHNLYLDIAAELGIPAALIFTIILFITFKRFWIMSKKQPFFIAGVASISIFAIHSLVENPMYSVHVLPVFLIILALSAPIRYEKVVNPE
jgi:putative inorganic carbon (HCO3(-)) transporter